MRKRVKQWGGRIFEGRFSRARVGARIPTAMLFFCCHKCHTWKKKEEKAEKKCRKNAGEYRKKSREKQCLSMSSCVYLEDSIDVLLKYTKKNKQITDT